VQDNDEIFVISYFVMVSCC